MSDMVIIELDKRIDAKSKKIPERVKWEKEQE